MTPRLEGLFPNLRFTRYGVESPESSEYNCIAYAAGETHRWWEPVRHPFGYWPAGVPRERTLESFVAAFETLGYEHCDDATLEADYEKVAIYVDEYGRPTHMAKQQESGVWMSKLGELEDIQHETLDGLEGTDSAYGTAVRYLRKRLT